MKTFPYDERYAMLIGLLRTLRKDAALTQTNLANKLGKHQSFVSKYEIGERRIDPVELYLICEAMDISLTVFAKKFEQSLKRKNL